MTLLFMLLMAFCASFSFGLLFNVPKETLFFGGVSGLLGQLGLLVVHSSYILGTFLGGVLVAASGELFAAWQKKPATIYIIIGIIPLVPGGLIYQTMLHFINTELLDGMTTGVMALLSAGAIAAGIAFTFTLMQAITKKRKQQTAQ